MPKGCRICRFLEKRGDFGLREEWLGYVRDGTMNYDALRKWLEVKGVKVSNRTILRHLKNHSASDLQIRRLNQESRKLHSRKSKTSLILEKEQRYSLKELGYGVLRRRERNEGLK